MGKPPTSNHDGDAECEDLLVGDLNPAGIGLELSIAKVEVTVDEFGRATILEWQR